MERLCLEPPMVGRQAVIRVPDRVFRTGRRSVVEGLKWCVEELRREVSSESATMEDL